jgi:hypothetical protein
MIGVANKLILQALCFSWAWWVSSSNNTVDFLGCWNGIKGKMYRLQNGLNIFLCFSYCYLVSHWTYILRKNSIYTILLCWLLYYVIEKELEDNFFIVLVTRLESSPGLFQILGPPLVVMPILIRYVYYIL